MSIDIIIIIFLMAIIFLLIFLIFRLKLKDIQFRSGYTKNKSKSQTLFDKTMEQTGYVNSKIDEIGDLTKK